MAMHHRIRLGLIAVGLSLSVVVPLTAAPALAHANGVSTASYEAVLGGSWRSDKNRARDRYRHPAATLTFFGLRPDQTVIEITPGGGWYSEILAPLLSRQGHYLAAVEAGSGRESVAAKQALEQKFNADPARYGKAAIITYDPQAPVLGAPDSADLVLTFRNVHNWVMANTQQAMFKAFYAVLKPGGVLGVVDHRASASASLDEVKDSGYLPEAYVIKLATDAGFRLVGKGEINANPKDTKDYPKGVWTLPPTLTLGEQDKARYLAIGESDRMTLRFVKPVSK